MWGRPLRKYWPPEPKTHLRMTDPRRLLVELSELTLAQCTASDGGQRVMCGVVSSTLSYLAIWPAISFTSDVIRRRLRLGLFDCTNQCLLIKLAALTIIILSMPPPRRQTLHTSCVPFLPYVSDSVCECRHVLQISYIDVILSRNPVDGLLFLRRL